MENKDQSLEAWKVFLGTDDFASASKNIENKISQAIGKNVSGMIWNDQKKTFNTTIEDVKKALELIQKHSKNTTKQAFFERDKRFLKMSKLLLQ